MRSTYVYLKTRTLFGKQCIFNIQEANLDEVILPDPSLNEHYILRNTCHKNVQESKQLALHEIQSITKTFKNTGMFHFEGGWPKEINPKDEETTMRFRRRVEKEDNWAPNLRVLFNLAENCILQNSAINIHDHYFNDLMTSKLIKPPYLRTLNIYADPDLIPRPVTNISWSPDSVAKIAVTHCYREFSRAEDYSFISYIWDIENSNEPSTSLKLFNPAAVTEFNPRDPSILASGLMSGQVCSWDLRTGNEPVQESHLQFSHRYPASCLKWMDSETSFEFFTGSLDGHIMWWDMRNLQEPTEVIIINLDNTKNPKTDNAAAVTSINYEPSVKTKFLFGTEYGVITSGSRKSENLSENIPLRLQGHIGPIYGLDRNPFNPKYILSIGDWTSRIWAEDNKEGNLINSPFSKELLTGGCWSRSRYSNFYVINNQGELVAWDILVGLKSPVVTMRLSEKKLTTIAPHQDGALLAIGDISGNVYLVEPSEALTKFNQNDRINLAMYLDRCCQPVQLIQSDLPELTENVQSDVLFLDKDLEADIKNYKGVETDINDSKKKEGIDKVEKAMKNYTLEEAEIEYLNNIKAEEEVYEEAEEKNDFEK